jgi:hypothetical protein
MKEQGRDRGLASGGGSLFHGLGLRPLGTLDDLELNLVAFIQGAKAGAGDCRIVGKNPAHLSTVAVATLLPQFCTASSAGVLGRLQGFTSYRRDRGIALRRRGRKCRTVLAARRGAALDTGTAVRAASVNSGHTSRGNV